MMRVAMVMGVMLIATPMLADTKIPVSPAGDITVESPPAGAANLIVNGDFEAANEAGDGPAHWQGIDGLVFHWIKDEDASHGRVLRIETDVSQSAAYAWWIKRFVEHASLDAAPQKISDKGYGSIGGLDGGFYLSDLIPIKEGAAYKVYVDAKGPRAKVFAFGYVKPVALSFGDEEPAVQEQFRKARGEPMKTPEGRPIHYYRRYLYRRWFTVGGSDEWKTYTHHDPMHPTGRELTQDVRYLRIMLYPYWPADTYWFDNVRVIEVPNDAKQGKPEADAADIEEGKVVK
ncbi:MAG: hypothetical protein GC162_03540 [Planctomycetes bacterium]|nr:hypothetical protein [Planctomycetota bacterium]